MKVFFDESYPQDKSQIIIGAVFMSNNAKKFLHNKLLEIKSKYNIETELKYNLINSENKLKAAKEVINVFFTSKSSRFKGVIVPFGELDLKHIKGKKLITKQTGVYVDSAKKLILNNIPAKQQASVFMDEEMTIQRTKLYSSLKRSKLKNGARIKSVNPVKSHENRHCLMQLCDLLTGAITQNLHPTDTKTTSGKLKNAFGLHLMQLTKVKKWENNFTLKSGVYSISHWRAPYFK